MGNEDSLVIEEVEVDDVDHEEHEEEEHHADIVVVVSKPLSLF
jgi:hypothetical protein